MLRPLAAEASRLLAPDPAAMTAVAAALVGDWRVEAIELLALGWHEQLVAAAAIALGGGDAPSWAALWQAIDGSSWAAPQLVAAAAVADETFEARAAARLTDVSRRGPKTIGALVRAYHRCPSRRMPVVAQLGRHDRTLATEEARIGVRGVDGWLDYFSSRSS
jgi:hypothetical protein